METHTDSHQLPQSDLKLPNNAGAGLIEASKWLRFGTFVVDCIGFMVLCFLIGFALAIVLGDQSQEMVEKVPDIVLWLSIFSLYYMPFELAFARTPGKFVFGTRVVAESGARASAAQIATRTACRFIPFEPLSFFVQRGWHDSISRTRVVRTRA